MIIACMTRIITTCNYFFEDQISFIKIVQQEPRKIHLYFIILLLVTQQGTRGSRLAKLKSTVHSVLYGVEQRDSSS